MKKPLEKHREQPQSQECSVLWRGLLFVGENLSLISGRGTTATSSNEAPAGGARNEGRTVEIAFPFKSVVGRILAEGEGKVGFREPEGREARTFLLEGDGLGRFLWRLRLGEADWEVEKGLLVGIADDAIR